MKIYSDSEARHAMHEYGIGIPLLADRYTEVLNFLTENDVGVSYRSPEAPWEKVAKQDLQLVHNEDFINRLFGHDFETQKEIEKTYELYDKEGKPHRYDPDKSERPLQELLKPILRNVEGTLKVAQEALKGEPTFFIGGGGHHAMSFGGRGFCQLNDIVIAIKTLQHRKMINTAWVIDVDAHKGDGTAELTKGDRSISTLSVHMEKGWPLDEEEKDENGKVHPWYVPSTIDVPVHLPSGKEYLTKLEEGLLKLSEINFERPDLCMIVLGSDPYEHDSLPSTETIKLSLVDMLERDKLIYNYLKEKNIPQAYVMAGGYGPRTYEPYCEFFKYLRSVGEI